MSKRDVWVLVIFAILVFVITAFIDTYLRKKHSSLFVRIPQKISEDKICNFIQNNYFSSIKQNQVYTLIIEGDVFDENLDKIFTRKQFIKIPDKMKIELKDLQTNKKFVFIHSNKDWFSEENPGLLIDALMQRVMRSLIFKKGEKFELFNKEMIINGVPCFLITHHYNLRADTKFKINTYINTKDFSFEKMEFYLMFFGGWRKVAESFFGDIEEMGGLKIFKRIKTIFYTPQGVRRFTSRVYSVKLNEPISDDIFEIKIHSKK